MIEYPSILSPSKSPHKECYLFIKYDGSNLRFEWSKKRGWYKFGTRKMLIDNTHPIYGQGINIFLDNFGDEFEKRFKKDKYLKQEKSITIFGEYFSKQTIAGYHVIPGDWPFTVVPFDIFTSKGQMRPKDFVKFTEEMQVAECLGKYNFSSALIEDVRKENIDVSSKYESSQFTPEGVVCKAVDGSWMSKIKTERYFNLIKGLYDNWEKYGE